MPFNQPGDNASVSIHGINNDVAGNQHNHYYSHSVTTEPRREASQKILKKLDPTDMDATHREECLPGTRADITDFILKWVQDTSADATSAYNVLWLRGVAGSGKSTLSTTIANRLSAMQRLAAFLFFERDASARSDPSTVIRTLAYKLGISHPTVGEAISANVTTYPEITHFPLRSQFQHLLVEPMTSHGTIDKHSPVVFMLDALDECGNPATRETLLELLAEQSILLPALFIITSRPLQDICGFFEDRDTILVKELDITSDNNDDDISSFLTRSMRRIQSKHRSLRRCNDWPGVEQLEKLVSRASGLFIWASTVCKFIDTYQPDVRLAMIIQGASVSTAEHSLDALYRTALEFSGSWDTPAFVADFRAVLGFILVARRPLSGDNIITLLGKSVTDSCIDSISQLGSVLQLEPTVRLLHPSFADFLFDAQRCIRSDFLFKESNLHHFVALLCIEHMNAVLKENLCGITLSPCLVHVEVPDDVAYVCMHWVEHICMANGSATVLLALERFLGQHFLHWVEAMSILKISRATVEMLERLYTWICIQAALCPKLTILIQDGIRFVRRHADVIEAHPLLVYSSALPFTPNDTILFEIFHDAALYPVSWGDPVTSVMFSSDSARLVSGSNDKTVRVWDASSGIQVLPALRGHEGKVFSVSFSPDDSHIISGAEDKTLRLWNASSGVLVFPPLRGHSDCVSAVAFSPDGRHIISGSYDATIRVWDANTGTEVKPPLKGHTRGVSSVACFTGGNRSCIVSGSFDKTVRVWNLALGLELLPPLQGHTNIVTSVKVSPSGNCIVSASNDATIRLWDVNSGVQMQVFSTSFGGPYDFLTSVAFSSDETRIVSSCYDRTIRIWNVVTGTETAPGLIHSGPALSVSLSPDGDRIASGAYDGTVRMWDAIAEVGDISSDASLPNRVCSLAFSPDGAFLISGSWDATIIVWDTASGVQCLPPLRGHTHGVTSVAFSPDGTQIVSGSLGQTVRVYDATTGLEVLSLNHSYSLDTVAFSSDGCYIVMNDKQARQHKWDAVSGALISNESEAPLMPEPQTGEVDLDMFSGWIRDRKNNYLSRLPPDAKPSVYCSHGRSLAIGNDSGEVIFIHFPACE